MRQSMQKDTLSDYWLSFCDEGAPDGKKFMGACIILNAINIAHAAALAHTHRCNPGGQILAVPFDYSDCGAVANLDPFTLYSKAEIEKITSEPAYSLAELAVDGGGE